MKMLLVAVLLLGLAPGLVQAQATSGSADLITKPHLQWHSSHTLWQLYPERAQQLGQTGKAVMRCMVSDADALTDCRILSEAPTGFGFGDALLRISAYIRVDHLDGDKRPVEGRPLDFPLTFALR